MVFWMAALSWAMEICAGDPTAVVCSKFNVTPGLFQWTPGFNQAGDYTLRFGVQDPSGLSDATDVQIHVVDENPEMRRDTIDLIRAAEGRPVYVLVNNKAEGCAPATIRALAEELAAITPW